MDGTLYIWSKRMSVFWIVKNKFILIDIFLLIIAFLVFDFEYYKKVHSIWLKVFKKAK